MTTKGESGPYAEGNYVCFADEHGNGLYFPILRVVLYPTKPRYDLPRGDGPDTLSVCVFLGRDYFSDEELEALVSKRNSYAVGEWAYIPAKDPEATRFNQVVAAES